MVRNQAPPGRDANEMRVEGTSGCFQKTQQKSPVGGDWGILLQVGIELSLQPLLPVPCRGTGVKGERFMHA